MNQLWNSTHRLSQRSAAIPPPTLILASLAECCPSEHSMLKTSTFNNVHWWWTDPAHIGMSTAGWRTDDAMRPSSHCLTRQLSITFTDGELILRTLECQLRVDEPMMLCDHLAKLPSFVWAIRKLCFILQPYWPLLEPTGSNGCQSHIYLFIYMYKNMSQTKIL